ncbi:MAG: class I SAM-dependent methyltransferase [Candidatus Desantisbacteria bacterium]
MNIPTLEICNKLIDVRDLGKPEWQKVLDEMHDLMKVPKRKTFQHCTDRRSLIHRAEIESYKHWEYPWTIFWGLIEPNMRILDCGCGRGFLQIYLALKGCEVVSVDISTMKTKAICKLWNLASKLKLPIKEDRVSAIRNLAKRYKTTVDFHVANISNLPFEKESFDLVYSISVLEHMSPGEDEEAMREMSRVLKIGGRLLVTVDFSPTPIPRKSYNKEDIHRLVDISGLRFLGDYDYKIDHWDRYCNDLKRAFDKSKVELSSAGFVLVKEE